MAARTAVDAELARIRADIVSKDFTDALKKRAENPGDAAANMAVMARFARIIADLQVLEERASRVPAPRREMPRGEVPRREMPRGEVPRREAPGVIRGEAAASITLASITVYPTETFYYPLDTKSSTKGGIGALVTEIYKGADQTIVLDGTGAGVLRALEPLVREYLGTLDVADDEGGRERAFNLSKLFFGDKPSQARETGGLTDVLVGVAGWVAAQASVTPAYAADADVLRALVDWLLLKTTLGRELDREESGIVQQNNKLDVETRELYASVDPARWPDEGNNNQLLIGNVIPYTAFRLGAVDSNADAFFARVYKALLPADEYAAVARVELLSAILGDASKGVDGFFSADALEPGTFFRMAAFRGMNSLSVAESLRNTRRDAVVRVPLDRRYAKYLGVLLSKAFATLTSLHLEASSFAKAPSTAAVNELKARFIYVALLWFVRLTFDGEAGADSERDAFERIGYRPRVGDAMIKSAASLSTGVTLDLIRDSLEGWIADQAALDADEGGGLKQYAAVLHETLLGSSAEALAKLVGTDGLTLVAPDMETVRPLAERKTYVSTHAFKPVRSFDELKEGRALTLAFGGGRVRVTTRRSRFAGTRLLRIGDDAEQRVRRVIKLKRVRILVVDSWEPSASARQAAASTERALMSGVRAPSVEAVTRALAVRSAEERCSTEALLEAYGEALATNAPANVHEPLAAELTARGERPATVRAYVARAKPAAPAPRRSSGDERIAAAERAVRKAVASRPETVKQVAHAERRAAAASHEARAATAAAPSRAVDAAAAAAPSRTVDAAAAVAPSRAVDAAVAVAPSRAVDAAVAVASSRAVDTAAAAAAAAAAAEDARVEDALLSAALSAARTPVPALGARVEPATRSAARAKTTRDAAPVTPAARSAAPAARSAAPVRANAVIAEFNGVLNKALDTIKASASDGAMFDAVTHVHTWYDSHAAEANAALEPAAWTSAMEALRTGLEEKGCVDESSTAYEHVEALAMLHRLDTA